MNYKTKDSGVRQEYSTGMVRDTQAGKPDLYLWIPQDIPYSENFWTRIGALATRGAEKYGKRNFDCARTEEELERFKSSATRHFFQWICNESDEDHAVSVLFNIMQCENIKWRMAHKKDK